MIDELATSDRQLDPICIRPIRAGFGAEIRGVDLSSRIAGVDREVILSAVFRYKVVIFRNQRITSLQHAAFAETFGQLYLHPTTERHDDVPTLQRVWPPDEAKLAKIKAQSGLNQISSGYHADTSWRLAPAWAGVLRAIDLPPQGGDTIWVDAERAFQDLSEDLKRRLRSLHVTHDFSHALRAVGLDYPLVAHPMVHRHPRTEREILWVNFAARPKIVGLSQDDSRDLLNDVLTQYQKLEYQLRLRWTLGTVVFWDNRATVHIAVRDYGDFPRLLERALIVDEPAYAGL